MATYKELNARPAKDFLRPENFRTEFDGANKGYGEKQYRHGREVSESARYVYIGANGTWGASLKSGGHLTSYEGIGYHAHTESLLRGFLDGPAPIVVYRLDENDKAESHIIKGEVK